MHLRASNVSLRFRLNDDTADLSDLQSGIRLGGVVEVYKGHRHVRALDNISLDLKKGDRLAVIGHNGSGKSTLLKVLAGIYKPHVGAVESDHPVSGVFNIGLGFRQEASGYRNIMLKGLIAGKSRIEIERAIPEIAEYTELGPYLNMPLHTYSQGMAMRLAFSVATAFSSEILLLDEWIGAGDAQFREKVVRRMTGFVESAHILVLASHSTQLLRRVANRAIWMEAGRIREMGDVEELLERYEADAREAAKRSRANQPIRKDAISLTITPAGFPEPAPGTGGGVGEIAWEASESGVTAVEVFVVGADGSEKKCFQGGCSGRGTTRAWLRPGMEFRLRDADTAELLMATTVQLLPSQPAQDASQNSST